MWSLSFATTLGLKILFWIFIRPRPSTRKFQDFCIKRLPLCDHKWRRLTYMTFWPIKKPVLNLNSCFRAVIVRSELGVMTRTLFRGIDSWTQRNNLKLFEFEFEGESPKNQYVPINSPSSWNWGTQEQFPKRLELMIRRLLTVIANLAFFPGALYLNATEGKVALWITFAAFQEALILTFP